MGEKTEIQWTDATWSPWEGCTKVSPGCNSCFAQRMNSWLLKGENWGPGAPRRQFGEDHWDKPSKWNAVPWFQCMDCGNRYSSRSRANRRAEFATCGHCGSERAKIARRRVFPSVCDPFDNEVPPEWRARFFALIAQTPNIDWLLLTKRIGNVAKMIEAPGMQKCGLPPNVWLGATVVNQEEADRDIPKLLAVPARVRFLSIEPMLGPIDLLWPETLWPEGPARCCSGHECGCMGQPIDPWLIYGINWVISGGESGPRARPAHPQWFRDLRDQCSTAGVPYMHKQNGEWAPAEAIINDDGTKRLQECWLRRNGTHGGGFFEPGVEVVYRVGKAAAGRMLDGRTHDGFPA